MLDSFLRRRIDPPLHKIAALFQNTSITPNHITWVGFFIGLMACAMAFYGFYGAALAGLILNRLCDGLDGAVARVQQSLSDYGGYLDITLDFYIYGGFPLCLAFGIGTIEAIQAAAFLLLSFIVSGVSFLAYAIIAAKNNMTTDHQGKKSFFYSNGLMEGTETILFLCLICVIPHYFVILCCVFSGLCILTGLLRLRMAYHVFK